MGSGMRLRDCSFLHILMILPSFSPLLLHWCVTLHHNKASGAYPSQPKVKDSTIALLMMQTHIDPVHGSAGITILHKLDSGEPILQVTSGKGIRFLNRSSIEDPGGVQGQHCITAHAIHGMAGEHALAWPPLLHPSLQRFRVQCKGQNNYTSASENGLHLHVPPSCSSGIPPCYVHSHGCTVV